ncbi:MAG: helicase-related protein [Bacillota bacterium]
MQELVPEARVALAHGQMKENELEDVMLAFVEGDYDVLVCTTIIENGLDIANVNTLIVDEADQLGLAQLYQLRGRVGRTNRLAYAYFTYRPQKVINIASPEKTERYPGIHRIWLRFQDCHAGSGDPGGREPFGTGAAWADSGGGL